MIGKAAYQRLLLDSPLLPAPMCNYSDRPLRNLMRRMGARVVYTEMYSSEAMSRGDPKTERLMDYRDEEPVVIVQIFGSRADLMAESARIALRLGADAIDINMGCPVKKITKTGCGAALAENRENARAIVRAVRRATGGAPMSVKTRWQLDGGALEIARMCEGEGVDAIALHARTRAQGYSGTANWEWIAELKKTVAIPVIGNGDVCSVDDAQRMREETGCDAVMVGRAIMGNPWLMRDAVLGRDTGPPEKNDRLRTLLTHATLMQETRGTRGMIEFRKHCANYIRGLRGARAARPELMQISDLNLLREALEKHFGPVDWDDA